MHKDTMKSDFILWQKSDDVNAASHHKSTNQQLSHKNKIQLANCSNSLILYKAAPLSLHCQFNTCFPCALSKHLFSWQIH